MKVGQIRNYIAGMNDDDEIIAVIYDRSEADDYIENNLCYLDGDVTKETPPLNNVEWLKVVKIMDKDDGIWQEFSESWVWSIERVIQEREKNVNSERVS